MHRIIQGTQQFQREIFPGNRQLFQRLASGQNPEALFITCSDSRVSPEWITQCGPGEIFVHRNAGNMAPSYSHSDAVSATIEYAVSALRIRHIVVCGHSDCGAMKGLLHPEAVAEMPDVRNWLRHGHDARNALEASHIPAQHSEAVAELAKINVRLQLEHLRTHPQVHSRLQSGDLELHGWFYRIESGEVQVWDSALPEWVAIEQAPAAAGRTNAGRETRHA